MSRQPQSPETFESALYRGKVRHRRFQPRRHAFQMPLFMLWLKVDEIDRILSHFWQLGSSRLSWGRFRRADYIGDEGTDIASAVRQKISDLSGKSLDSLGGEVFMLCQLRYLGVYFSPLNLYYLRQEGEYRYLLAEVSNTPWNERHYYLLDAQNPQPHAKMFHVSPFNPMEQSYHWRLTAPDRRHRGCAVHIESRALDSGEARIFDATLALRRLPLNQSELSRVLLRTPAQTVAVLAGIYWQAIKLWRKRLPLYPHPRKHRTATRKGTL